jgi:hypothetical protein
MLSDAPLNTTQLAGMLAFGMAGLTAFYASRSVASADQSAARQWRWIFIFQVLFCIEIWLGTRHAVHDMVNDWLRAMGIYQDRATLQKWMLVTLVLSGALAGFSGWPGALQTRPKSPMLKLAIACTAAVVLLFLIETVSLHAVDRVLYHQAGPVLLIAYAWMAGAAAVTGLAWRSATSRN